MPKSLYLRTAVYCDERVGLLPQAFKSQVVFGMPSPIEAAHLVYDIDFGEINTGSRTSILRSIESSLEAAILEYVKANFAF